LIVMRETSGTCHGAFRVLRDRERQTPVHYGDG
jgi:hypothetical protein